MKRGQRLCEIVMGRNEVGSKRYSLVKANRRVFVSSEIAEQRPASTPNLGIVRLQAQRLLDPRQRGSVATETPKHHRMIAQCRRIAARTEPDRLAYAVLRFVGLAEPKQHRA